MIQLDRIGCRCAGPSPLSPWPFVLPPVLVRIPPSNMTSPSIETESVQHRLIHDSLWTLAHPNLVVVQASTSLISQWPSAAFPSTFRLRMESSLIASFFFFFLAIVACASPNLTRTAIRALTVRVMPRSWWRIGQCYYEVQARSARADRSTRGASTDQRIVWSLDFAVVRYVCVLRISLFSYFILIPNVTDPKNGLSTVKSQSGERIVRRIRRIAALRRYSRIPHV